MENSDQAGNLLSPDRTKDLIDKGILDQSYMNLLSEHKQATETGNEAVAEKGFEAVQQNPNAADVLAKIIDKVKAATTPQQAAPDTTAAMPPPSGVPIPDPSATPAPDPASAAVAPLPQADATPQAMTPPVQDGSEPQAPSPTPTPGAGTPTPLQTATSQPTQPQQPAPAQATPGTGAAAVDPSANPQAAAVAAQHTLSSMTAAANGAVKDGSVNGVLGATALAGNQLDQIVGMYAQQVGKAGNGYAAAGGVEAQGASQLAQLANKQAATLKQAQDLEKAKADEYTSALSSVANLNIDPNRYWGSRTTEQKILAGIGMALSAFGGGHGAMDVINDAIKQDVEVQKANAELKLKGLQGRQTVFDMFHQIAGDTATAGTLAQASLLDQVKLRVEAATRGAQSDEAKANGLKTLADLVNERNKTLATIYSNPQLLLAAQTQQGAASATPGTGQPGTPQGQVASKPAVGPLAQIPKAQLNPLMLGEKDSENYVPGVGLAPNPDSAKEVRLRAGIVADVSTKISRLESLIGKNSNGTTLSAQDRASAAQLSEQIQSSLESWNSTRPLNKGTQQVLSSVLSADPLPYPGIQTTLRNRTMGNPVTAQLSTLKQGLHEDYLNFLSNNLKVRDPSTDLLSKQNNVANAPTL